MTALYGHIPYCVSKCPYCDFASIPVDSSVDAYVRALTAEAARAGAEIGTAETVYIGGGTPTILSPEQMRWLFERLRAIVSIAPDAEITVEANPCSLDSAKAEALAAAGVNRVSLGAQSFLDAELSALGRAHVARDIPRAVSLLRGAGIDAISLDLIYAIPNQSSANWRHSLMQAIELAPEHLSTYCLTFEHGTPFQRMLDEGTIVRKSEDEELEFYEIARELLGRADYEHYEISNFALPGKRSRHNMVYWSNDEYLGLGAGAVSYLGGRRIANVRNPAEYIRAVEAGASPACEAESIPLPMQAIETVIQRLRLREGIDRHAFMSRFGFEPETVFGDSLRELIELGLLESTAAFIRPSIRGWHLANEVALKVLP
jgi:oxygen-independent coproporphyrinogen-3 oxidase